MTGSGTGRALLAAVSMVLAPAAADAASACPWLFADGRPPRLVDGRLSHAATPLCSRAFAVLHSGLTRTPLWSAERLTRTSVAAAQAYDRRSSRFHEDVRLPPAARAEVRDYVGSGFDRGHMAPSGDMPDARSDDESFGLSNVVPQSKPLNRGGWASLEAYVRALATRLGRIYVVTGPLYEGTSLRAVGGRVLVPTATWKALYAPGAGAGAWIATNGTPFRWRVVSIRELTRRTGIDPFPRLDAATRTRVPAFPVFIGRHARSGERR